jgi:hypothetical protein
MDLNDLVSSLVIPPNPNDKWLYVVYSINKNIRYLFNLANA